MRRTRKIVLSASVMDSNNFMALNSDEKKPLDLDAPDLQNAVRILVAHEHALCRGDEDAADELLADLEPFLRRLTWAQNEWLRGLSGDLHMLNDEETFVENPYSSKEHSRLMLAAFHGRDSEAVLSLLRMKQSKASADVVAYGRSRAYSWLGFHEVAIAFLRHAIKLCSTDQDYLVFLLYDLQNLGQYQELWETAQTIFSTAGTSPPRIFLTVGTVFNIREHLPPQLRRNILGRLHQELNQALKAQYDPHFGSAGIALGYIMLGLVQEALGRSAKVEEAFLTAASIYPSDDAPWALLGNFLFRKNPDKAIYCFRQAIYRKTVYAAAYVVVAMAALNQKDYDSCKQLCHLALDNNADGDNEYRARIASAVANTLTSVENAENGHPVGSPSVDYDHIVRQAQYVDARRDGVDKKGEPMQGEQARQLSDLLPTSGPSGIASFLENRLGNLDRVAESMVPLKWAA